MLLVATPGSRSVLPVALAIAIAQRLAHAKLADAFVVVPAVVHEVDAVVDGSANDAQAPHGG